MMKKILFLACLLCADLPAQAQLDEIFAKKFSESLCKCTDKNTKKLSPELKDIITNIVRNPTTDTTLNFQPYYDYLEKNPLQDKLEIEANDKILICIARAFKKEAKQESDFKSYFVKNTLGNNISISNRTRHNHIAYFYYCKYFTNLLEKYYSKDKKE